MNNSELKRIYHERGYVVCDELIPNSTISKLQAKVDDILNQASMELERNSIYEFVNDDLTNKPRLERITSPHKVDPLFFELIRGDEIIRFLTALLGPNVRMQDSKLNLKLGGGSSAVEWHQDWAFYPHTNDNLLAIGVMIDDMTADNGPVMFVPGSHRGPIYDHYSEGYFCGAISPNVAREQCQSAEVITGPAGTVTIHHARLLHASKTNSSNKSRKLLLYEAMAADAWPLAGCHALYDSLEHMNDRMICGDLSLTPRITDVPVKLPHPVIPNASSIFVQQRHGDNHFYLD